jgi:hypothetical protein
MGDLSAMAGVLILDVLCEVGDLLVELEVGGLELGDAGHEALNPGLGLGERLGRRRGAPALVRQLRLQLCHLDNDGDVKIETSVADPDPNPEPDPPDLHVFGPPGSGSGSFYH